ncbi:hypothetical protein [Pseudomonas cerasi]
MKRAPRLSPAQLKVLGVAVSSLPNFYKSSHTRTTGKLEDLGLLKWCGSAGTSAYGSLFQATEQGKAVWAAQTTSP